MKMYRTKRPGAVMATLAFALTLCSAFAHATSAPIDDENTKLSEIITGEHRSESHIARNTSRHPIETLNFFELRPDMTVIEIWPGGSGWYTEILAPYLKPQGKFYAAHFSSHSSVKYFRTSLDKFQTKMSGHPLQYESVTITALDIPKETTLAPPGSVDRVLTFRNVHNWLKYEKNGLEVFQAMYLALKPGGILGVVEHRAPADYTLKEMQQSGYTSEAFTIALAKKAGFELLDKSEINANTKDSKDHPKGVWTLPPTLRLKDKEKEKYLAIGESDRMTLKFIKPR